MRKTIIKMKLNNKIKFFQKNLKFGLIITQKNYLN